MDTVLLIARLLLAVVFVVAGIAKLADRLGSRQALIDFGVPAVLVNPLSVLLPLAELAVAVALVPLASAWRGAVGALALLLVFIAGIGINLAKGRTPDCHCFGQLHSEPVGWPTLARNGGLAAVAVFLVVRGHNHPGASVLTIMSGAGLTPRTSFLFDLVLMGLLAVQGWLVFHLMRQNGRLMLRQEALEAKLGAPPIGVNHAASAAGLPVGAPAPAFNLVDLQGHTQALATLLAPGKPVLLIFTDPGCGPCKALLPDITRWQREHAKTLTVVVLSRGSVAANQETSGEGAMTRVLLQQDREVAQAYQAQSTPSAVIVRPDGSIGSFIAAGADAVRALVAHFTGGAPLPLSTGGVHGTNGANGRNGHGVVPLALPAVKAGDPAPPVRFPDLSGNMVDLADFRGSDTLLLFWNPGCGFCVRMSEDLKAWEAAPGEKAVRLLIVSTGSVEQNAAMGLRSPVLLDQGFTTGRAFGATGTPAAVLVDAEGNIASPVVIGASAVLALAEGGVVSGRR